MKRHSEFSVPRLLLATGALVLAASTALAQGGPGGGNGGGGGRPPGVGEDTAGNNLSYPAALTTGGTENAALIWAMPVGGGTLGVHYSYGCDVPDGDYPNYSCMAADGTYLDAVACAAVPVCVGKTVSRMYWQKVDANNWWAETTPVALSQTATHVDWGDNLESVSWSETSVIRVETTPYATLVAPRQGVQMWHVSGQGPDEQWGARATDSTSPLPYVYSSFLGTTEFYGSIPTTSARIDVSKLGPTTATCPTSPGGTSGINPVWVFDETSGTGSWVNPAVAEIVDVPFTAELNVSGKYVHGYNLKMRSIQMPGGWTKGGWWRLTFYTTDGAVLFSPTAMTTPPPAPVPIDPTVTILAEEEGSLYAPVVDSLNNLTYIDICVTSKKGGGGRRR